MDSSSVQHTETLERIVPAEMDDSCPVESESLRLHLERYQFATEHSLGERVLDIACGVGYGTAMISDRLSSSSQIIGVDCSTEAIGHAQSCFARDNIEYQIANAEEFGDAQGFNTIVSLETVEHLSEPQAFVDRVIGMLLPGGVLIVSVPVTPSTDGNPHHLHDFTRSSFRKMFGAHPVREIAQLNQKQPFRLPGLRKAGRLRGMRSNLPMYYLRNPDMFWKRICSLAIDGLCNQYLTIVWQKSETET